MISDCWYLVGWLSEFIILICWPLPLVVSFMALWQLKVKVSCSNDHNGIVLNKIMNGAGKYVRTEILS